MKTVLALTLLGSAALLAACSSAVEPPYDRDVCFVVEMSQDGKTPTFNKLAENQPQIEQCAARLEEMRLRFLRLGGTRRDVIGAYNGQYVFLDEEGVKIGKTLNGTRFMALARTGDGRLAVPGAISRDETGRPVGVAAPPPEPAPAQ